MKTALKFALVLGIVCLVMGSGVALVYATFKAEIERKEAETLQALLRQVLPEDAGAPEELTEGVHVVRDADGRPVAYAAVGSSPGYSGPVTVVVGVDAPEEPTTGQGGLKLTIRRVAIVQQTETPGLGANVSETRSTYNLWQKLGQIVGLPADEDERTFNPFLDQFQGAVVDVETDQIDRQIDAMTAATVTSNAVGKAVRQAVGRVGEIISEAGE